MGPLVLMQCALQLAKVMRNEICGSQDKGYPLWQIVYVMLHPVDVCTVVKRGAGMGNSSTAPRDSSCDSLVSHQNFSCVESVQRYDDLIQPPLVIPVPGIQVLHRIKNEEISKVVNAHQAACESPFCSGNNLQTLRSCQCHITAVRVPHMGGSINIYRATTVLCARHLPTAATWAQTSKQESRARLWVIRSAHLRATV